MTIVSLPNTSITIIPASQSISSDSQRVLFVGQKISGSATAGLLVQNIGNSGEEDALFGTRSILSQMIREARVLNKVTRFDAISLDDNGGATSAAGSIVFTGTATEDNTLYISVGSDYNYRLKVDILTGDTAADVASAVDTAYDLLTNAPITSSHATDTVTFTASNGGTVGNKYGIKVEGAVAGLTFAITAFSGGATDPVLTNLFDVIEGVRYQTVVYQSNLTTTELTNLLDPRFNESGDVLDGVGIINKTDTYANLVTLGNGLNTSSLTVFANKSVDDANQKGGAILEFDDITSSRFAALRSLRLTKGADISDYVIATNGSLDSIGGASIASLPYFNTPIPTSPIADAGKGFSKTEILGLNAAGLSLVGNNSTRTNAIVGEVLTTRKTDSAGNEELTFKYLNNVDTSSVIREYYYDNLKARFAQSRLTNGDLQPNVSTANKTVIEGYLDILFREVGELSLAESGAEAETFFKANRSVTIDLITGTATVTMKMPIVTQLRTFIATMQITF